MNQGEASVVDLGPATFAGVELLQPSHSEDLRLARLEALQDSPDAFVATLDQEKQRSDSDWIDVAAATTWAVAREGAKVVGIASMTAADPAAPTVHFIESVWVHPERRRRGLGRRMLLELEVRARAIGAEFLQLWVLETNGSAYDAYVNLAFEEPQPEVVQDSPKTRDDGEGFVQERLMVKRLG